MRISLTLPSQMQDKFVTYNTEKSIKNFRILSVGRGSYSSTIDINSSLGMDEDVFIHNIQIGRYTSIAQNVRFYVDLNHDMSAVYQGLIPEFVSSLPGRAGLGQMLQGSKRKGQIIIGNDCWIGNDVTILSGVTIHSGAVIGAGSVVTKDVPPYAIVVGNPAKIIRYRFPEDIIEKLLNISWWNWTSEELLSAKEYMQSNIFAFISKYEKESENLLNTQPTIPRLSPQEYPLFLHFLDFEDPYPVYINVIEQFLSQYDNGNAELVLCYIYNDVNIEKINALCSCFEEMQDINAYVNILGISEEEEPFVIHDADYLITNRDLKNITRTNYAEKYKISCLSGVDLDIFHEKNL